MNFKSLYCREHSKLEDPPYPTLKVEYKHVEGIETFEVDAKVDTGFFGAVTVDERVIRNLGLPSVGRDIIVTATETVEVKLFPVRISVPPLMIKDEPFFAYQTRRCLVGRRLLMGERWLLDNTENRFCLLGVSD